MRYPTKKSYAVPATTDKPGVLRIATQAEANAGTDNTLAITPLTLADAVDALVEPASTTVAGVTEYATDAEAQAKTAADKALVADNLAASGFLQWTDVVLTSAEVKALTTPETLVAAPAAGSAILFLGATLKMTYGGTNVFTESGDNLGIKYTDASGVQVCTTIECTGFIDAAASTYTNAVPKADNIVAATGAEAQALVLDNLGSDFAGNAANDNTLSIRTYYVVQAL